MSREDTLQNPTTFTGDDHIISTPYHGAAFSASVFSKKKGNKKRLSARDLPALFTFALLNRSLKRKFNLRF